MLEACDKPHRTYKEEWYCINCNLGEEAPRGYRPWAEPRMNLVDEVMDLTDALRELVTEMSKDTPIKRAYTPYTSPPRYGTRPPSPVNRGIKSGGMSIDPKRT